jgi:thiol-disulfide isomerase/thioredoxin
LPAIAAVVLISPAIGAARGDDDPARRALDEVVAAYKALGSYEDHGTLTIAAAIDGQPQRRAWPMAFRLQRPDKFQIEAGGVRLVSDGKTLLTVISATKRYLREPAPARPGLAAVTEGPAGSMVLGGPGGGAAAVVLQLLLGDDPARALLEGGTALRLDPDQDRDGHALHVLILEPRTGPKIRLLADAGSHLVRRVELVGAAGPDIAWDAGEIATAALPAERFAAAPPAGLTEVSALQAAGAGGQPARHELLGKHVPEFTLTVLDAAGKTRRVTRDELAGKVVLLDFWATWCGPCLRELPEIAALIAQYEKAGKAVVVIAASQDRVPKEGTLRELVETTLAEQKLEMSRPAVGLVALDPEMALGQAFQIEALPTVFLIDGKGVVQAVHVGYQEDVRATLTKDIDALLDGKSLLDPPKPEAAAVEPPKADAPPPGTP